MAASRPPARWNASRYARASSTGMLLNRAQRFANSGGPYSSSRRPTGSASRIGAGRNGKNCCTCSSTSASIGWSKPWPRGRMAATAARRTRTVAREGARPRVAGGDSSGGVIMRRGSRGDGGSARSTWSGSARAAAPNPAPRRARGQWWLRPGAIDRYKPDPSMTTVSERLRALLAADRADREAIAELLDGGGHGDRMEAITSLGGTSQQARLWTAAAGSAPVTQADLVPTRRPPVDGARVNGQA